MKKIIFLFALLFGVLCLTGFTPSQNETIQAFYPLKNILELKRNRAFSSANDYKKKQISIYYDHLRKYSHVDIGYGRHFDFANTHIHETVSLQHFSEKQDAVCTPPEVKMLFSHSLGNLIICSKFVNKTYGINMKQKKRFIEARIFVQNNSNKNHFVIRYSGHPEKRLFSMLQQLKPKYSGGYMGVRAYSPEVIYKSFSPFERVMRLKAKSYTLRNSYMHWYMDREKPDLYFQLTRDLGPGPSASFDIQFSKRASEKLICSGRWVKHNPSEIGQTIYNICLENSQTIPQHPSSKSAPMKMISVQAQPKFYTKTPYRITMYEFISEFWNTLESF